MSLALQALMRDRAQLLTRFLDFHFEMRNDLPASHRSLVESVRYSTLQEGSKRFRPILATLTAEALGQRAEQVLPFAAAVECVHTYSLIHDDLPAMDNDDFRRGQPTNHKKFGEATAILAGDALLTEAFQIVADNYVGQPELAVKAIAEIARASGLYGMVGGQAIDMGAKSGAITLTDLRTLHRLKTGALIRLSVVGAAILCRADADRLAALTDYAENLGLAFQVADDILDYNPEKPETGSYPALMGIEAAQKFLQEITENALARLKGWPNSADALRELARYNAGRQV